MINKLRSSAIYDSVVQANDERVFHNWHVSSLAMCPKAHYMKRLGVKTYNQPTGAKILRWGAGHCIEDVIREHISKVYGETESNIRITSDKYDLTGEYDNLTIKDHRLVEVKSVHDLAFIEKDGMTGLKYDTGGKGPRGGVVWAIRDEPHLHYALQQHGYVLLLKERGITVANIDYIFISLSGRVVAYSTKVDAEKIKWLEDRIELLNKAWKTKTPPPCTCKEFDSELYKSVYQYCDYKDETNATCCEIK